MPKKFFSENQSLESVTRYPSRIIYSDKRSITSTSDGFSVFSPFNFFDMYEKYGHIYKIIVDGENEAIVGQENALSKLFVNKSLTTLMSDQSLSVQGGEYISENSPPKYITTSYGVQSVRNMILSEYGIYVLDTNKGALINIDGPSVKILTNGRMENYFNLNFSKDNKDWLENELELSFDCNEKNLYIIGYRQSADKHIWLSYNSKVDAFVSNYDWSISGNGHGGKYGNRPFYIFDLNGTTYCLQSHSGNSQHNVIDLHVSEWKGGNGFLRILSGQHVKSVDAQITHVFNKNPQDPKVLDIVGTNSDEPFSSYRVLMYKDSYVADTGTQGNSTIRTRLGMSSTNYLRSNTFPSGSTGYKRLVGSYGIIDLFINNDQNPVNIRNIFTVFRKVLRW